MVPACAIRHQPRSCAPCARGDGPEPIEYLIDEIRCSPHPWGWSLPAEVLRTERHLLPAPAGMVPSRMPVRNVRTSAPRGRGEQTVTFPRRLFSMGPSPRARGAADGHLLVFGVRGVFPACTGSRKDSRRTRTASRGHPRIHGEQAERYSSAARCSGSFPRTQGTDTLLREEGRVVGVIPGHAGSSNPTTCPAPRTWGHPRIRGEQSMKIGPAGATSGPSPHTRGWPRVPCTRPRPGVLLPAGAGSRA